MRVLISVCLLFISLTSFSQRQLVLLKKGKIMHIFMPGDDIYLKIKGNPDRIHSYINNILDNAVVLHHDTIPFHTIERTYLEEGNIANLFGGLLVAAGSVYFIVDQMNELREGNGLNIDKGVAIGSGICLGVGIPMLLTKKKSQKISYKYRLMMVKKGDPMYR